MPSLPDIITTFKIYVNIGIYMYEKIQLQCIHILKEDK
jgi:hypothetical protein